ncbi:MAG: M23 family metallopeptidase [Mucinivorans sp.]
MKQNKFFAFFGQQSKFSMRSVRTGEELWHIFISRGNFILASIAAVVVLFLVTLTVVAYTSILDLVPGYPGNRSRKMLISSIVKLDSLEREVALWENYTTDLQMILDGRQVGAEGVKDSTKVGVKGTTVPISQYEEKLRAQMAPGPDGSNNNNRRRAAELTFEMITPVVGTIKTPFAPAKGIYGVMIHPAPNSVALAVMDGTVVLNTWSPEWGTVIAIQHAGGMMSIYKGLARSLRAVDQRIKAGQSVGVVERISEKNIPELYFELWSSGNPVDPENYISF